MDSATTRSSCPTAISRPPLSSIRRRRTRSATGDARCERSWSTWRTGWTPPEEHTREDLSGSVAARDRPRGGEVRPHRHRDTERLRLPDALRPAGRFPAAHHQEGAHPLGGGGAVVV